MLGRGAEPGGLELDAMGFITLGGEQVGGLADALDGGQGDHDAVGVRGADRGVEHGVVAAADEHGVRGRQADQRVRGAAFVHAQADAVAGGVGADPVALGLVGLDRDDPGAEPGALDRDRARARAHVPDGAARRGTEPGQHERADFRLGDHRVAVAELVLGQGPAGRRAGVAGQPAGAFRVRGLGVLLGLRCSGALGCRAMRMLGSAKSLAGSADRSLSRSWGAPRHSAT